MSKIDSKYIFWTGARAVFHRGWWLVTSLYLVIVAHFTPSQLVLIGVIQGIVSLIFEVPAGVVADTLSRKWSIIISHILMGTAMLATGLVTKFPLILATQMLWGISWSFSSGADVALITDELNEPLRINNVLTQASRSELWGSAVGIISIGLLAAATSLKTAMIFASLMMFLLGLYVITQFTEVHFQQTKNNHWLESWSIFKNGVSLVTKNRTILLMFLATFLVNGAAVVGRLYSKRLTEIGFPSLGQPIAWLTGLSILSLLAGVAALRIIEPRVNGLRTARKDYALVCVIGAFGLLMLAFAPTIVVAFIGVILMDGIRSPLTRTLATIQVNKSTTNDVRATVHSFLAQSEYFGEIVCGIGIVLLARSSDISAFVGSSLLMIFTALIMISYILKRKVL